MKKYDYKEITFRINTEKEQELLEFLAGFSVPERNRYIIDAIKFYLHHKDTTEKSVIKDYGVTREEFESLKHKVYKIIETMDISDSRNISSIPPDGMASGGINEKEEISYNEKGSAELKEDQTQREEYIPEEVFAALQGFM